MISLVHPTVISCPSLNPHQEPCSLDLLEMLLNSNFWQSSGLQIGTGDLFLSFNAFEATSVTLALRASIYLNI